VRAFALILLAGCGAASATASSGDDGEIVFAARGASGRVELHAMRADGSGRRVLVADAERDLYPAPAPGLAVAVRDEDDGAVHVEQLVRVDGDRVVPLGEPAGRVRGASASRDGRVVVVESDRASFRDLYRVDPVTGASVRLTDDAAGNFEPAVSPDGARVAFVSSKDGDPELYVMPAAGGAPTRLTAFHREDLAPVWSPDGARLLFVSDREGVDRLFIVAADGTELRRVTDAGAGAPPGGEGEAAWSPDGSAVAFTAQDGRGGVAVYVTELASGVTRRISPPGYRGGAAAWSPDGTRVVLTLHRRGGAFLVLVGRDGGAPRALTSPLGDAWLPRWHR
jgi:Tol biopolymer transport system component